MSTEFHTEPPITWLKFLETTELQLEVPKRPIYQSRQHCFVLRRNIPGRLVAFRNEDDTVHFERFGSMDPMILLQVMEQYNVRIVDHCGLGYPELSGG